MIRIQIGNSYSQITGLTPQQFKQLRKVLSYSIDPAAAYYMGAHRSRVRYLISAKGDFPTGLLERVAAFLEKKQYPYETADTRKEPEVYLTNNPWPGPIPYPDQMKAVEAAIQNKRGIISMPTGTGKSLVIALIAHRLRLKTLVVTPSLEIKNQLKELLGVFHGVIVCNVDSVKPGNYDCLIIDEAHHSVANTYQKLNKIAWKDIYYRFYLTATPFRTKREETMLFEGVAGKVIFQLTYKDAIAKGYIVPVEAYYVELPKRSVSGNSWAQVYKELIVKNELRNYVISQLMMDFQYAQKSTLCLVKEIDHGKTLEESTSLPFSNGMDEESRDHIRQFNSGGIMALIGTTGILGEGVDTKPAEYVIIAGLGKAKGAFMQQVGRAVRKYPGKESAKVIIFKDPSHRWTLKHFNEQCRILKTEYGVTPIKLDL